MMRIRALSAIAAAAIAAAAGCAVRHAPQPPPQPSIIPHSAWQTQPPLGYAADATRRNAAAGDPLAFRGLTITVLGTAMDSSTPKPTDIVRLRLGTGTTNEVRVAREGSAFNWQGFHVAVVAIYGPGELGAG